MRTRVDSERLPTGTATFMFTDVEDSTRLLHHVGEERYRDLLEAHYAVVRRAIGRYGGTEVATEGDSFFAVFTDPLAAVDAAADIHSDLRGVGDDDAPVRVRIGLHTGRAVLGGDNYIGVDVHRASRISHSGHGGQVLASEATAHLLDGAQGIATKPLGRYRLAGFPEPALLYQVAKGEPPQDFPPLRAARAESHLPELLTEFVGREAEIRACLDILADHRLLTLTGPGGTGKTRMALEIARQCEADFGDGAYFVALAPLVDPELIPMAILGALGLKTASGVDPWEHLVHHLSGRSTLLILDNFEQLLDGTAVVSDLLKAPASLRLVVTSRSPLRVHGEREFPVPPLEVPRTNDLEAVESSDAIRLFVSRARAVRPDFILDQENLPAVQEIVSSVDGLPLAIELAASRLRSITPELLLERLDNRLLASRSADLPERQQTIVNTISWSYDLLEERNKVLFEELSVFSGTFGLVEAEQVCRPEVDVFDGLTELVEQSLLRQVAVSGEPRFRMLTVIREFAYAALVAREGDGPILDRHARVYLDLAERADAEILTSRQHVWLVRLGDEHDNLRSAFDHCVTVGDAETALRLVGSLWRFWQISGHLREGLQRAEIALAMSRGGTPVARAHALTGLGGLLYWQGEWEATLEPYDEALRLFRQEGSEEEIAEALYNASFPLEYTGQSERAIELLEESLALSEKIGRDIGVGRALWGLGNVANQSRDWKAAVEYIERSVEVFSRLDAPFDLGWAWFMLAHSRHNMGEITRAVEPLEHALDVFSNVNDISAMSLIFDLISAATHRVGSEATAAYFIGASQRLKMDTGIEIGEVEMNRYPELQALDTRLRKDPTPDYEEGNNTDLDEVIQRARSELSRLRAGG